MNLSLGPWMALAFPESVDSAIPERWDHIIMVRSIGRVGAGQGTGTPVEEDRGFHVVTLDREGLPALYWKFRSLPGGEDQHREVRLIDQFRTDPRTAPLLLRTWSGTHQGVQVQAAEVVPWPRMDEVLRSRDRAAARRAVRVAVEAAEKLTRVAVELSGEASRTGVRLVPAEWPSRADWQAIGLEEDRVASLKALLHQAGSVPCEPQHGDYWPSNVFVGPAGECRVLDLDEFGRVAAPGYDLLHLCRTSSDLTRGGRSASWLKRLRRPCALESEMQRVLRETLGGKGFSPFTTEALICFYLLDILFRTFRRGGPEEFWGKLRDDVEVCADLLETEGRGAVLHRVLGVAGVVASDAHGHE